jgi:hypothetical protein
MTRVNVGVEPHELCDKHLVAEYRELPRVFAYTGRVISGPFRLGRGHVLWCAQYPGSMATRYRALVAEMRHRGFTVNHPEPRGDGAMAPPDAVTEARPVVLERLREKLLSMKPRWTKRPAPSWWQHDNH